MFKSTKDVIIFQKFFLPIFLYLFVYIHASPALVQIGLSPKIKTRYLEAQSLFYQKRYQQAAKLFKELTVQNPNHIASQYYYELSLVNYLLFRTWFQRSTLLYKLKRFNHALIYLDRAETIYPFGDESIELKSEIKSEQKSHSPLEHLNQKEHKVFTNTVKRAQSNLAKANNETALKLFATSLNLAPQSTVALEGYNEAQKRYLAGKNNNKVTSLLKQARALDKKKKKIQAVSKYKAVLRFDPANREAINRIPELQKEISDAKVLAARDGLAKQYKNTGKKFIKDKKFDKAIEQYKFGNALLSSFTNWNALIKEAKVLRRIADEEEAQKLNQQVERNYNRGLAFVVAEKYRSAITAFQQVVTGAKKLQRTFMVEQANDLLRKITRTLVQNEEGAVNVESPYYNLVQSLKVLGLKALEKNNFKLGKKIFSQIINLFPYNRFANQYLAVCKIKINPETKAKIMEDFIKEVKVSLIVKKAIKAQRLLDVILFIDKDYKGVKELVALIGKNKKKVIGSSVSNKRLNALWNQALAAQKKGDSKGAIQIARQILRLNPSHTNARSLLSRLESGKIVRVAPAKVPAGARKAYTQGILHYNTGALKSAFGSFRAAIRIAPNYRKASIALKKCQRYLAAAR